MFTVKEVAQLFGIEVEDSRIVTSVEFDSRKVVAGSLFVPLAGARDGHTFIHQAIANGAIATFWSVQDQPEDISVIQVTDCLEAMQQLATYYRELLSPKVVAITGSNGKTTTKDLTASVLSQAFRTYKTQGNYNNEIGLPYTILHMPKDTEVVVLEMGMDHAGDLTTLSTIARPDIAAITMIGEAHIENLGSRAKIAQGKMEIATALAADGCLIIPCDEPLLAPLVQGMTQQVVTFGIDAGDVAAHILEEYAEQTVFSVKEQDYRIPLLGTYNVKNALIAYSVGEKFGVTPEQIANGLKKVQVTQNRTQWLEMENGTRLLSDVYNANPTAMGLVLDSFGKLPVQGRRFAVLADMLELGPESSVMHAAMADHVQNYDGLFLVGEQMDYLAKELAARYSDVPLQLYDANELAALIEDLKQLLQPVDMLLLKGSNGMKLYQVVDALTGENQ